MTVIGITGTREGCNAAQLSELRERLVRLRATDYPRTTTLHHGDCVGVDAEAHEIALELGMTVECHPPNEPRHRAYTTGWHTLWREQSYRMRNMAIVEACDILLAVPERPESTAGKSGTWMTVRMARARHVKTVVIKGDRW